MLDGVVLFIAPSFCWHELRAGGKWKVHGASEEIGCTLISWLPSENCHNCFLLNICGELFFSAPHSVSHKLCSDFTKDNTQNKLHAQSADRLRSNVALCKTIWKLLKAMRKWWENSYPTSWKILTLLKKKKKRCIWKEYKQWFWKNWGEINNI